MNNSEEEHPHCVACYDANCSVGDACPLIECSSQCGARFHSCKEAEHHILCKRAVVACVNSQHGCPFTFDRLEQAGHLRHCPANVVCCSHLWFRRNRKEREVDELVSDPPLPTKHIDFALAYRDQEQIGGAEVLEDCSVDPRPANRVANGLDIRPRSDSVETLKAPCFSPLAILKVPHLVDDVQSQEDISLNINEGPDTFSNVSETDVALNGLIQPPSDVEDAVSLNIEGKHDNRGFMDSLSEGKISRTPSMSAPATPEPRTVPEEQPEAEPEPVVRTESVPEPEPVVRTDSVPEQKAAPEESVAAPDRSPEKENSANDAQRKSSISSNSTLEGKSEKASKSVKSRQFSKLLSGKRSSRDSVDQGIGKESPTAPTTSPLVGSSSNVGVSDSDAFQASMGTKLRSHVQSSRRKIAKVFSGKLLNRSHAISSNELAPNRLIKHKLGVHASLSETVSLEVVTHKDSVVVDEAIRLPRGRTSASKSPCGSPEESTRSEYSITMSSQRLKQRWDANEKRFAPTSLINERDTLISDRATVGGKLLFELPIHYNPRHVYPDDGYIQCQCSQAFRRDEIADHQAFVHAGVDSMLTSSLLIERCPMAMFGCGHNRSVLAMPLSGWQLCVVKGALAIRPKSGVTAAFQQDNEAPRLHLTTLPTTVLKRIVSYLDPLALSSVAETCGHLRSVVATCVQERGMVVPVWQRSEDDSGDFHWSVARHRWTMSTFVQAVPLDRWVMSQDKPIKEHLRFCRFACSDACHPGAQWKPLIGLTDLKFLEITTDEDHETEEEEDESDSDVDSHSQSQEAIVTMSACPAGSAGGKKGARLATLQKVRTPGSQVRRRAKSVLPEEDEFSKSLAVDALLGDVDDVDDIEDGEGQCPDTNTLSPKL